MVNFTEAKMGGKLISIFILNKLFQLIQNLAVILMAQ